MGKGTRCCCSAPALSTLVGACDAPKTSCSGGSTLPKASPISPAANRSHLHRAQARDAPSEPPNGQVLASLRLIAPQHASDLSLKCPDFPSSQPCRSELAARVCPRRAAGLEKRCCLVRRAAEEFPNGELGWGLGLSWFSLL